MHRGDRIKIVSGPYQGHDAVVIRKTAGANYAWFCFCSFYGCMVMVYEGEIEDGDGEVTR